MLLIDDNNRPTNTVYYLSALVYDLLKEENSQRGINSSDLYEEIVHSILNRNVNFVFFVLALDFLFLLDKLEIDGEGRLHVH